MRSMKYRAMNKKGEWLYFKFPMVGDDYKTIYCIDSCIDIYISGRLKIETLSEYTGLNDKNDKEIYDGDIVKLSCSHIGGEHIGEVKKHEYGEWIPVIKNKDRRIEHNTSCGMAYWLGRCKILGNIHENPELLGKE